MVRFGVPPQRTRMPRRTQSRMVAGFLPTATAAVEVVSMPGGRDRYSMPTVWLRMAEAPGGLGRGCRVCPVLAVRGLVAPRLRGTIRVGRRLGVRRTGGDGRTRHLD